MLNNSHQLTGSALSACVTYLTVGMIAAMYVVANTTRGEN
jgi:hypothetical protein